MVTDVLALVGRFGCAYNERNGEVWIAPCPFCDDGQSNPTKQVKACRGLSVNLEHGGYHCLACSASGVVTKLAEHYGVDVPRRDDRAPTSDGWNPPPRQRRAKAKQKTEDAETPRPVREYQQAFGDMRGVVDYLKGRGFDKDAVQAWRLGAAMRSVGGPRLPCVAIPSIAEDGTLLAWKFRPVERPEGGPKYTKTKGTPQPLVGLHLLPSRPPYPPVYVTEGEFDAVALWQYGIRPVVSIPSGAATAWTPEWVAALKRFGQVFLCYDDDKEGETGVQKAAEALGVERCKRVRFPRPDAAECLEKGFGAETMHAAIRDAEPAWRPEGIPTMPEFVRSGIEWLREQEKLDIVSTGIHDLDQSIGGGFAPGDLTFIYGQTAHGKSTLALSVLFNALRAGVLCLSASAEYVDAYHLRIIAGQRLGKHGFKVSADDMEAIEDELAALPLIPVPDAYDYAAGKLPSLLRWANAQGVRIAVLDPLDHVMPDNPATRDYYGDVAAFVRNLVEVVRGMQMHLVVVCPVTKEGDLAGRNSLKHDAWNLIEVVRDSGQGCNADGDTSPVQVVIHKARRTGTVGRRLDLIYLKAGARIADPYDREGRGVPF